MLRKTLTVRFNQAVIGKNDKHSMVAVPHGASEDDRLDAAMAALGMELDVGMGEAAEIQVDEECREENLESTESKGACCYSGTYRENEGNI